MAPRFGLVVLGRNHAQPFRELVESYGLSSRPAGICALELTPEDRLRDHQALRQPIVEGARRLVEQAPKRSSWSARSWRACSWLFRTRCRCR